MKCSAPYLEGIVALLIDLHGIVFMEDISWKVETWVGGAWFLNYMGNERARLEQVVPWKLIPWKVMNSNTTNNRKHDIWTHPNNVLMYTTPNAAKKQPQILWSTVTNTASRVLQPSWQSLKHKCFQVQSVFFMLFLQWNAPKVCSIVLSFHLGNP